ncbi:XRE-type transcriptional regulator [Bifidobacterium magnum]|uniref:XRE-type transcriptional regulator n=2 Tax=Bifidobacterium magnum TaxID=1692 RepID=A0A087BB62_9BIFI|nr:XRE-type transcriptional regulator [Bifidobacterium magnum]
MLRQNAGMTAEDLAEKMRDRGFRWNTVTVSKIENGERQLKLEESAAMMQCVGMGAEDLPKLFGTGLDFKISRQANIVEWSHNDLNRHIAHFRHLRDELAEIVAEAEGSNNVSEEKLQHAKEVLGRSSNEEIVKQVKDGLGGWFVKW